MKCIHQPRCVQKSSTMEEDEEKAEAGLVDEDEAESDEDGLPYVRSKGPLPRRITDNRYP